MYNRHRRESVVYAAVDVLPPLRTASKVRVFTSPNKNCNQQVLFFASALVAGWVGGEIRLKGPFCVFVLSMLVSPPLDFLHF